MIEAQGHEAPAEHLDVTARIEVEALADEVVERFGRVDILVNSAGSAFRSPVEDFPEDKLDFILDLNLKGTYLCPARPSAARCSTQRKGSIINLASIGSFIAYPWASAYLASKGGVLGITRAFALEWRDRGVRVNGIGPTLMDSDADRRRSRRRPRSPRTTSRRACCDHAWGCRASSSERPSTSRAMPPSWSRGHTIMCDDGYLTA